MKQTIISLAQQNRHVPKSQPSRLWFMNQGYEPINPALVFGRIFYIRIKGQEVSILDANGRKGYIEFTTNEKWRIKNGHCKPYYCLKFAADGRTRHVRLSLLVMATFNHQVPDRSKGEVIDHIDGNTLNDTPRNLRIVTRAINDRDGGFMRKLRHSGYNVAVHPASVILAGYERMARWKAEHTTTQYTQLRGKELLQVFVGPDFTILDIDPMDLDFAGHPEF